MNLQQKLQRKIKANHVYVVHTTRVSRIDGAPLVADIPEKMLPDYLAAGWKKARPEAKEPVEAVVAKNETSVHQKQTEDEVHPDQQKDETAIQTRYGSGKKGAGK